MRPDPLPRVLLTGGARSGKSTLAERLVGDRPATFVATAPPRPGDAEWDLRVAEHRARRPEAWQIVESADLPPLIRHASPGHPVLVDCLTLWLAAHLDRLGAWPDPAEVADPVARLVDDLAAAVAECPGGLVLVTNEVGSGIVPADPGTRQFRDWMGVLNRAVADRCDRVFLVAAGRALPLEAW